MKGLPPIIYGDGSQQELFSYIEDVTRYIQLAGFQGSSSRQIINTGPTES